MSCIICNDVAKSTCSKCNLAKYCGRECQKKDWSEHKKICCSNNVLIEFCRKQLIEVMGKKIMGNIYMLASNKYKEFGLGTIVVTIEKTIEEFSKPGLIGSSLQCAYLSFVAGDAAASELTVEYKFNNYKYTHKQKISDMDLFLGLNNNKVWIDDCPIFFDI